MIVGADWPHPRPAPRGTNRYRDIIPLGWWIVANILPLLLCWFAWKVAELEGWRAGL